MSNLNSPADDPAPHWAWPLRAFARSREVCAALHGSPAWLRASWRRKIKLAAKEYTRQIQKNPRLDCLEFKHALLWPLRIVLETHSTPVDYVLRFNVPNKLGKVLTWRARKTKMLVLANDLFYAGCARVPYSRIPLCRYSEIAGRHNQWLFWARMNKLKSSLHDREK